MSQRAHKTSVTVLSSHKMLWGCESVIPACYQMMCFSLEQVKNPASLFSSSWAETNKSVIFQALAACDILWWVVEMHSAKPGWPHCTVFLQGRGAALCWPWLWTCLGSHCISLCSVSFWPLWGRSRLDKLYMKPWRNRFHFIQGPWSMYHTKRNSVSALLGWQGSFQGPQKQDRMKHFLICLQADGTARLTALGHVFSLIFCTCAVWLLTLWPLPVFIDKLFSPLD